MTDARMARREIMRTRHGQPAFLSTRWLGRWLTPIPLQRHPEKANSYQTDGISIRTDRDSARSWRLFLQTQHPLPRIEFLPRLVHFRVETCKGAGLAYVETMKLYGVICLWLGAWLPLSAEVVLRSDTSDSSSSRFGTHLDIDLELAVVGAPWEEVHGISDAGAAHVFRREGAGWTEVGRLISDSPQSIGWFGQAVAIDGNTIVVGCPTTTVASMANRGQVQIFQRASNGSYNWSLVTTAIAPGGAAYDNFGDEVVIEGDYIAVGAPRADLSGKIDAGKVYIYQRGGLYLQTLSPTDAGAGDQFGDRISMTADYLFISAPEDDLGTATNVGGVYIYKRTGTTWAFSQKLVLADATRDDFFGNDVAASGDRAVVGCRGDDTPTLGSGAAYVYRREGTNWVLDGPRLTSPAPRTFDVFASSVAIERDKVIIGASGDDESGGSVGAVHVFHRPAGTWTHASKRLTSLPNGIGNLGSTVAVGGNVILAGAVSSNPSGSVHSFRCEVNPLIFVPGIAASRLTRNANGVRETVWPTIRPSLIEALDLNHADPTIQAVDILRTFNPVINGIWTLNFYAPFMDYLHEQGYEEFALNDDPTRLSSRFMLDTPLNPKPTLFPFPYDWRLSNEITASKLRVYLDRIRELYPGREVDIVTHSMGGLVARRMILDSPAGIGRVATIAAPIWGVPDAIERILAGRFFRTGLIDYRTNDEIMKVLSTFPSAFELLPGSLYWNHKTRPIMEENGWDYNSDGSEPQIYTQGDLRTLLGKHARSPVTVGTNDAWHGRPGQDDWHNDPEPLNYLHIAGVQECDDTTEGVTAESIVIWNSSTINSKLSTIKGPGDGTVTLLSSSRLSPANDSYVSPNSIYRRVTGESALLEHSQLPSLPAVQAYISQFLDGALPVTDAIGQVALPCSLRTTTIRIIGRAYARVRDGLGNVNTALSEIAYLRIPGVSIQYGGDQPWMEITAKQGIPLQIDGANSAEGVEAEIVERNSAGGPISLRRYRFTPTSGPWLLDLPTDQPSVLTVDNGNGVPDAADIIPPTHSVSPGQPVDIQRPTLSMNLTAASGLVTFTFQAQDAGNPVLPAIRYRLGNGLLQTYTQPLVLAAQQRQTLFVFAEDATGNLSGPIATAAHPPIQIGPGAAGMVELQWSFADGFTLEVATNLTGPWEAATGTISQPNGVMRAGIPTSTSARRYFRLKSGQSILR
jgi:pimeloyl-ACP methyl ester carboxylesterase